MEYNDNRRGMLDERKSAGQENSQQGTNNQSEQSDDMVSVRDEWFSRSPEENVKLLNEESETTGVYGFAYYGEDSYPDDIPGMNMVTYALPGDKNGGRYVGYESYEQTYLREKEEYEAHLKDGTMSSQVEMQWQNASEQYKEQKTAYQEYRKEYPGSPDYLKEKNPVSSYHKYDTSIRRMEKEKEAKLERADKDISMQDVGMHMSKGETVFLADTASEHELKGKKPKQQIASKEPAREPQQYVIRQEEDLNPAGVKSIQGYLEKNKIAFDKVSSKDDPDAYGAAVIDQMNKMDEHLKQSDSSYRSEFPENLRYYKEGENPVGIPGMTLVVGKIEGAPGFYAGYESYDATYRKSLQKADADAEKLERDRNNGTMPAAKLADKMEENRIQYENANEMYDFQKTQYLSYVDKHPGNDFLSKSDAVTSYQEYQSDTVGAKEQDVITNIKGLLVNGWNGLVTNLDQLTKKVKAVIQNVMHPEITELEDAAVKQSEELDAKRKSHTTTYAEQEAKESSQMSADKLTQSAMKDVSADTAVSDKQGKNIFKQIVQQNTRQPDRSAEKMTVKQEASTTRYGGLTGVDMLDTLNRDEKDVVVNKLLNSVEAAEQAGKEAKTADSPSKLAEKAVEKTVDHVAGKSESTKKEIGVSSKSSRLDKLADLDARLAAGAAKSQEEELSFSRTG